MKVDNVCIMSHLLEQLGLRTHRYTWMDEANVESGNGIQVGDLRLPTVTWSMWMLSIFKITHVMWIKHNGAEMHIIGPDTAIRKFMKLCQELAHRRASADEVKMLKQQLGITSAPNDITAAVLDYLLLEFVLMVVLASRLG